MPERAKHIGKTQEQRQAYGRYLKSLDYEPTLEEGIDFGSTENGGEELSESTSKRRPKGYIRNIMRDHFSDHWLEWVFGGLLLIGLFLINESRVTTTIMNNTLSSTSESVDKIEEKVDKMEDKLEVLNLQTVINTKDIEFLKK